MRPLLVLKGELSIRIFRNMTRFTPLCHTLSARNSNTLSPISRQRLVQNSFIDNMTASNVLNYSTVLNIISDFTREQKADESVVSALSICTHRYTKCTTKCTLLFEIRYPRDYFTMLVFIVVPIEQHCISKLVLLNLWTFVHFYPKLYINELLFRLIFALYLYSKTQIYTNDLSVGSV